MTAKPLFFAAFLAVGALPMWSLQAGVDMPIAGEEVAAAAPKVWTEVNSQVEWDGLLSRSKAEGKPLLVDFTGSDWCGWCIKLKQEVFVQELFKIQAPKHFILVEVDFPSQNQPSAEIQKYRTSLGNRMGVKGYPTILMIDGREKVIHRTGYQRGGPKAYLEMLLEAKRGFDARLQLQAKAKAGDAAAQAELQSLDRQQEIDAEVKEWLSRAVKKRDEAALKNLYKGYRAGRLPSSADKDLTYLMIVLQGASNLEDLEGYDWAFNRIKALAGKNPRFQGKLKQFETRREEIAGLR